MRGGMAQGVSLGDAALRRILPRPSRGNRVRLHLLRLSHYRSSHSRSKAEMASICATVTAPIRLSNRSSGKLFVRLDDHGGPDLTDESRRLDEVQVAAL
jgi:hypothetical protein